MPSRSRRRWFQFSLKTLLVSTLVLGALLGWVSIRLEKVGRQQATIAAIERLGGKVNFAMSNPPETWLSRLLLDRDDQYACNVHLPAKREETVECLKLCAELKGLRLLSIGRTRLEAGDLVGLKRLTELRTLAAASTTHGDELLGIAAELPNLAVLQLTNTPATDAGLGKLGKSKTLAESLVMLAIIGSPAIGDEGLAGLTGLKNLDNLSVEGASVTDAGLAHLAKLPRLRRLNLNRTSVTPAGIGKLQQALPRCQIAGPPPADADNAP